MRPMKIVALAMLAILALPSLTMAMGGNSPDDIPTGDGTGLACAIERARLYLDKVRTLADNLADEYPEDEMIQGYLDEIYALLGQDEEGPKILLQAGTYGAAEWSDVESHSGTYSAHLETTGTAGDGDEARIVITMPTGFTLGDLQTLSWMIYTVSGYPAHVDITLDTGLTDQDMLTAEMAVNQGMTAAYIDANLPGDWVKTFELTGNDGYGVIDDDTVFWVTKMGSGDLNAPSSTLGHWKTGTIDKDPNGELTSTVIDSSTPVLKLEIEVDNWVVQTEAYVDDVEINGVTYDFEEEPEDLGAEDFLDRASAYLGEGDFNSAARSLASARNILGRVKGLLTSVAKAHKVARTERFMEQVRRRIEGIVDKVDRLKGRLGEGKANNVRASMGLALGRIRRLGDDPSENNGDGTLDGIEDAIAIIDEGLGELDGEILEAIDRLEAKTRVFSATVQRLSRRGEDTSEIEEKLNSAEDLLSQATDELAGGDTEGAGKLLEEAEGYLEEAWDEIHSLRGQGRGRKGKP